MDANSSLNADLRANASFVFGHLTLIVTLYFSTLTPFPFHLSFDFKQQFLNIFVSLSSELSLQFMHSMSTLHTCTEIKVESILSVTSFIGGTHLRY